MDENLNVVNATQENVVDSQNQVEETNNVETVNTQSSSDVQTDVSEGIVNSQVQTQEDNARFAAIRRDAETKGMDRAVAAMGMEWNGKPIKTYAEYQRAIAEQRATEEAEKKGIDPQFYSDFQSMKSELDSYKREKTFMEQEKSLSNDPVRGQYFNEWKDEVKDIAMNYGVDLRTAYTLLLDQRLPDILSKAQQRIQNETIQNINKNASSSPGALSSETSQTKTSYMDMSKADFEAYKNKVLNGEAR